MKNVVKHAPEPEKEQAKKGIIAPQPMELAVGTYVYRFADRAHPTLDHRAGCWWVGKQHFEAIVLRAKAAGVDLGHKARWDLAVLTRWSNMDLVLEAKVTSRLWAWTGLAKQQLEVTPHGKVVRMFGNSTVHQLYLIGVVGQNSRVPTQPDRSMPILTQLGRSSLILTGAKSIQASSTY